MAERKKSRKIRDEIQYRFHIKRSSDNYAFVDKRVLNDSRLSFAARGLWIYLVNEEDGASIPTEELAEKSPGGLMAYNAALNELVQYGYLTIETEEGKEDIYIINEIK